MASIAEPRIRAHPYDYRDVRAIASELELAEPVAVTLVRRGHRTVDQARAFLEAAEAHDPFELDGMEAACELVLGAARAGRRLTVHGDYDVDGVSATAILVACLRSLGADCDWLIPDRLGAGYGLSAAGVEELARRGTELLITVDCGIGSAEAVRAAREAGIEVLVTDHHQPPERLPDCPILHPRLGGYPFGGLCGAGVAHKLAEGLRASAGGGRGPSPELDLVALATVADLVPLLGENRRLVREGLLVMRTRPREGLRALLAVSRTEIESLDAGALAFRLAPRINAAGRLYRADAGVELLLTEDPGRAAAIAAELDRANQERRATEREVLEDAERARSALPPESEGSPAIVLAGEGWHPGVVGIVASRMVERHWKPVVLIGLEGGRGRGSARSVPGFDLVGALEACSGQLERFGGHPMAAGLEIDAARVSEFRKQFTARARERIDPGELARTEWVDALVGVGEGGIGMPLAEQLELLGPFGSGNPEPRLLVPAARLRDVRPLGEGGRHSRFELVSGSGRASGVAFGVGGDLAGVEDLPADLTIGLELDRWNGSVQPRVILRERHSLGDPAGREPGACGSGCPAPAGDWWARALEELERAPGSLPEAVAVALSEGGRGRRELVDRRGGAAIAAIAELVSGGASVLAVCADAARRRPVAGAADPARFGGEPADVVCCRCDESRLDLSLGEADSAEAAGPGMVLADWGALCRRPLAARRFEHVLLLDPPPRSELEAIAALPALGPRGTAPLSAGFVHFAWGPAEVEFAERCLAAEWELRPAVAETWQALQEAGGEAAGEELVAVLSGGGRHRRTPEVSARCIQILSELGLCEWRPGGVDSAAAIRSTERTELARSSTYLACRAEQERGLACISGRATELAAAA
jgi:single-stranded-DNA-specific exonuclease